jgi:putative FmdB family regulatory protein
MPIYSFRCKECGHRFEQVQKMSTSPPPCPKILEGTECGQETTKQVSRSSFHLKGGGWYATDYKKT